MFEAKDSEPENSDSKEVYIALLTYRDLKNDIFVAEISSTRYSSHRERVAGEEWYKDYVKDLTIKYKNKLQTSNFKHCF